MVGEARARVGPGADDEIGNSNRKSCYRLEQLEDRVGVVEGDIIEVRRDQAIAKVERVQAVGELNTTLARVEQRFDDMLSTLKWSLGVIMVVILGLVATIAQQLVRDAFFK